MSGHVILYQKLKFVVALGTTNDCDADESPLVGAMFPGCSDVAPRYPPATVPDTGRRELELQRFKVNVWRVEMS